MLARIRRGPRRAPVPGAPRAIDSPGTHLAFVVAFALALPAVGVLLQWFYLPDFFTALEYSYVIGSHCEGVLGRTTTVGLSPQSAKCVQVFISERSEEQLRVRARLTQPRACAPGGRAPRHAS